MYTQGHIHSLSLPSLTLLLPVTLGPISNKFPFDYSFHTSSSDFFLFFKLQSLFLIKVLLLHASVLEKKKENQSSLKSLLPYLDHLVLSNFFLQSFLLTIWS